MENGYSDSKGGGIYLKDVKNFTLKNSKLVKNKVYLNSIMSQFEK